MSTKSELKVHMFCAYSALIFVALISAALIFLAHFFPPPSPAMNSDEVFQMFSDSRNGIRIAMVLVMISACFYMMLTTVTAHYVSIVEGRVGVLTLLIALAGSLNLLAFCIPAIIWLAASFRVESAPEIIQMVHDMGWLMFLGLAAPTMVLMFATAIASFVDDRAQPLFPRWYGYFNFWALTMFLPGQLIFFFQEGVFAWDGLVGFWLPAADFFIQFLMTAYFVWRAIKREQDLLVS